MTKYNERLDDLTSFMESIGWEFDENGYTFDDNYINFRTAAMLRQAIIDWHNKQTEAVLDRLESMAAYDPSGSSPVINPKQIEAERNKLKGSKNDQL